MIPDLDIYRSANLLVTHHGEDAANALAEKITRRPVTCDHRSWGRYDRAIARCTVAGEDLEAWMVANGWVLAYKSVLRS